MPSARADAAPLLALLLLIQSCMPSPQPPSSADPSSAAQPAAPAEHTQVPVRQVQINGRPLPAAELAALEQQYQVQIRDGAYWYDPACGAWGIMGSHALGVIQPGLRIGGPLDPGCSQGNTGVFINGRHLNQMDVQILQTITPVYQGRWWLDAAGNFGTEGNPYPIGNLAVMARQRQGGSYYAKDGTYFGSDGNFSYFSFRNSDGSSGGVTILDGQVVY
ncbi:MAG: hypothetical protein NW241_14945 [Bacteroidia bacterium]|nr:hypothetical protein [Bacteroidia bacterium]